MNKHKKSYDEQHGPNQKPDVNSGAPEGGPVPAPHVSPPYGRVYCSNNCISYEKKFTIPPMSTKLIITSHIHSMNT